MAGKLVAENPYLLVSIFLFCNNLYLLILFPVAAKMKGIFWNDWYRMQGAKELCLDSQWIFAFFSKEWKDRYKISWLTSNQKRSSKLKDISMRKLRYYILHFFFSHRMKCLNWLNISKTYRNFDNMKRKLKEEIGVNPDMEPEAKRKFQPVYWSYQKYLFILFIYLLQENK